MTQEVEEQQTQEEANYYFTLSEINELINRHGAAKVLSNLNPDVEEQIYWHYYKQLARD